MRREKKPNLFPGLGAGAGAGSVLERRVSRSFWLSGVVPRFRALEVEGMLDVGTGEGLRDAVLTGTAIRLFAIESEPNLESVELVRLWWLGKLAMLLCMIGDGSRSPCISGVPSLLGLDGLLELGGDTGEGSARWASSGTGCIRGLVCTVEAFFSSGGLCGTACKVFFFCSTLPASATTVDADEEEVDDSRTVDNPCVVRALVSSGSLCRLIGGRLSSGLTSLTL